MRRSTSVDSSTQFSLHPLLKAALGSLDVQLEEELNRYRRLQGRRSGRRQDGQAGSVAAVVGTVSTHTVQSPMPSSPPSGENLAPRRSPDGSRSAAAAGLIPPLAIAANMDEETLTNAILNNKAAESFADPEATELPEDYLASSEQLLKSLAEEEAELRAEEEPRLLQTLLTPLGIGSMLLLLLSSITFGYLFTNPNSFKMLGLEKWLRSAQSEPELASNPPSATNPQEPQPAMSPDLSSDEFVDINLSTLSTLPATDAANSTSSSVSPMPTTAPSVVANPEAAIATASTSGRSSTASAPTSAPAASPASRPAASSSRSSSSARPASTPSSPARARQPQAAPSQAAAPRPAPQAAAPRPAAPASPQTAPAPTVAAAPAPARQDLYYVVTEYTGDRSLEQAREAVGEAYVRNFPNRAVVQMGAFSDESGAQQLRQELQQNGISAQVYQP